MMNKKIQITAALLGVLVTTAVVAGATYASSEDTFLKRGGKMGTPMHTEAERELIQTAFDNNDYNAWVEAVGADSQMAEKINTDNFSKLITAHNLMQEGKAKMEEAKVIFEELGIENHGKGQRGQKEHKSRYNTEDMQAARDAIDNSDFSAWVVAVGDDSKIAETIDTNEKFLKLVEAHNLMQDGDLEGAKEAREELGLDTGRGMKGERQGKRGGNGMGRGTK